MAESDGRTAEGEIEIAAPVERVWRAITEAEELERWFPLEAKVEAPGVGGRVYMSWGGEHAGWSTIEAWDPPNHLRITWRWGEGHAQVTDMWLESDAGRTRMRVVTSGFPEDATWDDMVEGTRLGWLFELRQLQHYLEHHAGEPRRALYVRRRVELPRSEAWDRVAAGLDESALDEVFDRTSGWQLAGVMPATDALFRLTIDPTHDMEDHRDVSVWISAWGGARDDLGRVATEWRDRLARLFPEGQTLEAQR